MCGALHLKFGLRIGEDSHDFQNLAAHPLVVVLEGGAEDRVEGHLQLYALPVDSQQAVERGRAHPRILNQVNH